MNETGRILFADDEETFLQATCALLRQEGYECDGVADGAAAVELLRAKPYDLLISDIKMPGNVDLRLIREVPQITAGLPVILVTGYPSLNTAVQAVELPVMAYLTKPFRFDALLQHVRAALKNSENLRLVRNMQERAQDWHQELDRLEQAMIGKSENNPAATTDAFMTLTLRNLAGGLMDLQRLNEAMQRQPITPSACQLLNCPRPAKLTAALREAISALEETKRVFKSKEIASLRRKLQELLDNG